MNVRQAGGLEHFLGACIDSPVVDVIKNSVVKEVRVLERKKKINVFRFRLFYFDTI